MGGFQGNCYPLYVVNKPWVPVNFIPSEKASSPGIDFAWIPIRNFNRNLFLPFTKIPAMKKIIFLPLVMISFIAYSQTNIICTNVTAEQVLNGNYNL